jgi:hypothetical protein
VSTAGRDIETEYWLVTRVPRLLSQTKGSRDPHERLAGTHSGKWYLKSGEPEPLGNHVAARPVKEPLRILGISWARAGPRRRNDPFSTQQLERISISSTHVSRVRSTPLRAAPHPGHEIPVDREML